MKGEGRSRVPAAIDTVADLIHQLGDIPPERILWNPIPGTATEEHALRLIEVSNNRRVELIDGVLVEKPMGFNEGFLAGWLITALNIFVLPRKLGLVGSPDSLVRLRKGQLRMPDVSYYPWASLPGNTARAKVGVAPAIAVEILSESNTRREIEARMKDYFAAGTKLLWVVDPRNETIRVHTSLKRFKVLTTADTLDGGRVLPGLTINIAELFASIDPPTQS
jgi:Uma2 family endonuclease